MVLLDEDNSQVTFWGNHRRNLKILILYVQSHYSKYQGKIIDLKYKESSALSVGLLFKTIFEVAMFQFSSQRRSHTLVFFVVEFNIGRTSPTN